MNAEEEQYRQVLSRFVPLEAVEPVYTYVMRRGVNFKITYGRKSKLGDYRAPRDGKGHRITVNGTLRPYFFLWVFLHEAAHLETYLQCGTLAKPHGKEWQDNFRRLVLDYNRAGLFPEAFRPGIETVMTAQPFSVQRVAELESRLREVGRDGSVSHQTVLDDLPTGSRFQIARYPGRTFRSVAKLRTRHRIVEEGTGDTYLVSGRIAVMSPHQEPAPQTPST